MVYTVQDFNQDRQCHFDSNKLSSMVSTIKKYSPSSIQIRRLLEWDELKRSPLDRWLSDFTSLDNLTELLKQFIDQFSSVCKYEQIVAASVRRLFLENVDE